MGLCTSTCYLLKQMIYNFILSFEDDLYLCLETHHKIYTIFGLYLLKIFMSISGSFLTSSLVGNSCSIVQYSPERKRNNRHYLYVNKPFKIVMWDPLVQMIGMCA